MPWNCYVTGNEPGITTEMLSGGETRPGVIQVWSGFPGLSHAKNCSHQVDAIIHLNSGSPYHFLIISYFSYVYVRVSEQETQTGFL